jgi:hypothetical protein
MTTTPSDTLSWRLPPAVRCLMYLVAALLCSVGFIFGIGPGLHLSFINSWVDQAGSRWINLLWGIGCIAGAVASVILLRRMVLVLGDNDLFVRNMFRSYRVPLTDIEKVSQTDYGVWLQYTRDGRSHLLTATAGIGLKAAWTARMSRSKTIARIITARLPPPAVPTPHSGAGHLPSEHQT